MWYVCHKFSSNFQFWTYFFNFPQTVLILKYILHNYGTIHLLRLRHRFTERRTLLFSPDCLDFEIHLTQLPGTIHLRQRFTECHTHASWEVRGPAILIRLGCITVSYRSSGLRSLHCYGFPRISTTTRLTWIFISFVRLIASHTSLQLQLEFVVLVSTSWHRHLRDTSTSWIIRRETQDLYVLVSKFLLNINKSH